MQKATPANKLLEPEGHDERHSRAMDVLVVVQLALVVLLFRVLLLGLGETGEVAEDKLRIIS